MNMFQLIFVALILDAILGEPEWLWSSRPHPVTLMGRGIDWLDARLNIGDNRRRAGTFAVLILVVVAGVIGQLIALIPDLGLLEMLGAAILLAHRSLMDHVKDVAIALKNGLKHGRNSVSMIVGRDPEHMEESDVARAAIESAAENFSDGVVAPVFWFLLFGLPGILIYKIVNTADNMIGHKNEKYAEFGWAAAKLDDVLNWIPARLTGALICAAHLSREAFQTMITDAPTQRSPNAGWPEAALAGVLDYALSGPRRYYGNLEKIAWLNESGEQNLGPADIDNAVSALWRTWFVGLGIVGIVAVISF